MTQAGPAAARILVVDDIATNRDLVATVVRHLGHLPLEAADGAQALEMVRSEHPDLVISDILMPTMDGLEFVSRLRADAALADTEVVFYTARYREREAGNLARICGVSQVLLKPCSPQDIIRVIRKALDRPEARGHAVQAPPPPAPAGPTTAQLLARLHELELNNQRLTALTRLNLHMACERDSRTLLDTACRSARDLIGARYAVLGVDGREPGSAVFVSCGIDAQVLADHGWPPIGQGLLGQARRQAGARVITNPGGDPGNIGLPRGYPAVHRALIAPVTSAQVDPGWICLADKLGADDFDDQDVDMLATLAAQLGYMVDSSMLYDTVQRDAQRLQNEIRERRQAQQALHDSTRQLRALSRRVLETQETERRRVARELHDELGQSLTAIKIDLQSQLMSPTTERASVHRSMRRSIRTVDHALTQMRRLALGLRPSILDDLGLAPALRWLAEDARQHGALVVQLQFGREGRRMDPQHETVCFRIAQEALTNALRHARATRVALSLDIDDATATLCVSDNGTGFDVDHAQDAATQGSSMGLLGMRERASLVGGRLEIESGPGRGTTVRLTCPLTVGEAMQ